MSSEAQPSRHTTTASATTTGHEGRRRLPGCADLHPVRLQRPPAHVGDRRRGRRRHIRKSGKKGVSLSEVFSDADCNRSSDAFDVTVAKAPEPKQPNPQAQRESTPTPKPTATPEPQPTQQQHSSDTKSRLTASIPPSKDSRAWNT
ncbi:MAG: hypothetical protein OXD31_02060 [Chloroflexi bacterium]|nr:hypothetical protein [Chloroflexota bacterium]